MSKYEVFSGPYFPAFGLNTERYKVFFLILSESRKIRTRKNSVFRYFSRCANSLLSEDFYRWIIGAVNLYFMNYLCMVIILFSTDLCKYAFSKYSFGKLSYNLSVFLGLLPVLFCIWCHLRRLKNIWLTIQALFLLFFSHFIKMNCWKIKDSTSIQKSFEFIKKV